MTKVNFHSAYVRRSEVQTERTESETVRDRQRLTDGQIDNRQTDGRSDRQTERRVREWEGRQEDRPRGHTEGERETDRGTEKKRERERSVVVCVYSTEF